MQQTPNSSATSSSAGADKLAAVIRPIIDVSRNEMVAAITVMLEASADATKAEFEKVNARLLSLETAVNRKSLRHTDREELRDITEKLSALQLSISRLHVGMGGQAAIMTANVIMRETGPGTDMIGHADDDYPGFD